MEVEVFTRGEAIEKDLKQYFTNVPCKNGHLSFRYTSNGYCTVCSSTSLKSWRSINKDKEQTYKKKYRSTLRGKALRNKNQQEREARKLQATRLDDDEFNLLCIDELYHLAQLRKLYTGIPHDVDHIIPLRGKEVCGFHVWYNLQVISHKENEFKNNKLVEEHNEFSNT